MNSKRVFFGMIGALSFLILASVAVVVLGNGLLHKRAEHLTQLKVDNRLLEEQQAALTQANKDIQKYSDLEQLAKSIVPQDKDQARAVREILKIAGDSNIPLSSISFPSSTLGTVTPKPAASSDSSGATTPAVVTPPISQLKAVEGMSGVYSMDITVQSDQNNPRPYANMINFLAKLEQNRRTAQVTQLVITPDSKNIKLLSFTLTIKVFVKP